MMYKLAVEILFSILLVYPMDFLTHADAEMWRSSHPELSSFLVLSEAEIAEWQGPAITIPTKPRR